MSITQGIHAAEANWIFRGGGVWAVTASDESVSIVAAAPPLPAERTVSSVTDGPGFGFGLEYLFGRRLGLEIATLYTFHDYDVVVSIDPDTFTAADSLGLRTFTLGANYHFASDGRARWSAGAYLAQTFSDDVTMSIPTLGRSETLSFDQDYGLGVKVALDLPISSGNPWTFSIEGRYLLTILESEASANDIELNPIVLSASLGYRF